MSAPDLSLNNVMQVLPVTDKGMSRLTRWTIAFIGLTIILAGGAYLFRISQDPLRFPVVNVDVMGTLDYANRDAMMAVVRQQTEQGFYGLNIGELRHALEQKAWIASARISRVWPARIAIEVEEHEPTARWNDDSLVSKRLELFKPPQLQDGNARYVEWQTVFASLPQLRGGSGRHSTLLDSYRAFDQQLEPFGLTVFELLEDERRSVTLTLSNQVVVRLGYENVDLRMNRFLDVYERLAEKASGTPLSFDMRYSNGFALGVVNGDG